MDFNAKYKEYCSQYSPDEAKLQFVLLLKENNAAGIVLDSIDLSGADLSNVNLFMCKISNSNFANSIIINGEFTGSTIEKCDFSNSKMEKVGFGSATIKESQFFNSNLSSATFTSSQISTSDFRCVNLHSARMREAKLLECDFTGANMEHISISSTAVSNSVFNEVSLNGSRIRSIEGYETAHWIGTDIRDINFAGAYHLRRFIQDENYIYEFKNKSKMHLYYYYIWKITSNCGRSLSRWLILILIQIALFTIIYTIVEVDYGKYESVVSPLYYSISTMTTLGYGDVVPASGAAQIAASLQVVFGYIMLGGLLSILTNKLARRAD